MNDLGAFADIFEGMTPFSGHVDRGFMVDFLGVRLDAEFRAIWGIDPTAQGGREITTQLPTPASGEGWFEACNWVAAAREARGSYVMMTLGACYGNQAVRSYLALQALNPLPAKLVAVEPVPENIEMTRKHFRDNGIDPDDHWIIEAAMSDSNAPVLFPVGSPGSGTQNCIFYNSPAGRAALAQRLRDQGQADQVGCNLLAANATGITVNMAPDRDEPFEAELRLVSAVTIADLLGPFDRVDFIEADLQCSEVVVFPPAMALMTRKVRRVHLGTHGADGHVFLEDVFRQHGWEIVFSYGPGTSHDTPNGRFSLNDGVLTAVNPALAYE